jgi:hypothetical protein
MSGEVAKEEGEAESTKFYPKEVELMKLIYRRYTPLSH